MMHRERKRKDKKKTNDFNWRKDHVKQRTVVSEGAPISPKEKNVSTFRSAECIDHLSLLSGSQCREICIEFDTRAVVNHD